MARSFSHISLTYIKNRIGVKLYEIQNPGRPWLTQTSISIIDSLLKPDDMLVETGSGRSSFWFANRCGEMISIEHNAEWHQKVHKIAGTDPIWEKVDYRLIEDPDAYVAAIKDLPNGTVDFLLVDGIERDRCALAGTTKVKAGGMLVVDNINWFLPSDSTTPNAIKMGDACQSNTWTKFAEEVKDWRRIWTTNGVSDTCIWIKPH